MRAFGKVRMGVGQDSLKLDTLWPSLWCNGGNRKAFGRPIPDALPCGWRKHALTAGKQLADRM
jgi:hypothetical protein